MGQERESTLRLGRRRIEGEALLETAEIIFRPIDGSKRLKFAFADISKSVKAVDGELRFHTVDGPAVLELGPAAEKWADKIVHPKSRVEKLGVTSGMQVLLMGSFEDDFKNELKSMTKNVRQWKDDGKAEFIFVQIESPKDMGGIALVAEWVKGAMAMWIVYPKGNKQIT